MKNRMSISRQNLALLALAGCFLCLITGCAQVDAEKQMRLRSLKDQRKSLTVALNETKREIYGTKGESGKQKRNQEHLARIDANLKNADFIRKRSERFWQEHQSVFMEEGVKDIFSPVVKKDKSLDFSKGHLFDGRLCFGTSAIVSAAQPRPPSSRIGWMAMAPGNGAASPIPIGDAKKDIQNAKASVVAKMEETPMSPFAKMEILAGLEKGPCVLMDHALPAMPAACLLDGFELLLAPGKDGKAPLQGKSTIVLVTMSAPEGGAMQIQEEQRIELGGKDKDICQLEPREDGRYLLRVFFGDKYGSLPIKKGQYWGLCVPQNTKVSCEYLGWPDGMEGLYPGGDVWVALAGDRELKFARPLPKTFPKQVYAVSGCVYDEKTSQNGELENKIRQTLRPAVTMAVFGTQDVAK